MTTVAILFWAGVFLVFYTYLGYGILLWLLVKIREAVHPARRYAFPADPPEVTLLIAAYNEQEVVAEKMANCRALDYPAGKLRVTWITDGSTDRTVELLAAYPEVTVLHDPRRGGKTAALNRALGIVRTPLVVFTDANTMLNPEAVAQVVRCFEDPAVGCVAGEKRVAGTGNTGAAATEGVDDFVCSMLIAAQGYRIAYCKEAYALESPSADMGEEGKRKKRIAAGGLQSVWRLRKLLNPFRYGVLWFQYVSHRALRWTLTPVVLVALLPLNVALLWSGHPALYAAILALQCAFYLAALTGWALERSGHRNRLLFIPYYFLFMNLNVFRGASYLATHRGKGAWEKARRA